MSYDVCPISGGVCVMDLAYCAANGCQCKDITPAQDFKRIRAMKKREVTTKPTPKRPQPLLQIGSYKRKRK